MSKTSVLHQLFPTSLYVADVENAEQLNAQLLPNIYRLRDQDMANVKDPDLLSKFANEGWTSYFSRSAGLVAEPWTNRLQAVVLQHVDQFVKEMAFDFGNRKPRITTLFANIHEETYHRHDAHTHPGSMFSGTYYAKSYPGAGRFRLISPVRALQFHEFSFREQTERNVDEVALECVAGRIVMFQSHVPHMVDRPSAKGERIAIAFNVNYE